MIKLRRCSVVPGDPIEVGAAAAVLSGDGCSEDNKRPVLLTAGKSWVGHTEVSAVLLLIDDQISDISGMELLSCLCATCVSDTHPCPWLIPAGSCWHHWPMPCLIWLGQSASPEADAPSSSQPLSGRCSEAKHGIMVPTTASSWVGSYCPVQAISIFRL